MSGKPNPRRANGSRRNAIRARWRAIGAPCGICGQPIDYSLGMVEYTATDPDTGEETVRRRPHPRMFVVDEIVPVSRGGDPLDFANTRPAHWECNARRGDGTHGTATARLPMEQPVEW